MRPWARPASEGGTFPGIRHQARPRNALSRASPSVIIIVIIMMMSVVMIVLIAVVIIVISIPIVAVDLLGEQFVGMEIDGDGQAGEPN